MRPIDFDESNRMLEHPHNRKNRLPIWTDGTTCVSVWKASFFERVRILFTGKVWLSIQSGGTQHAASVAGENMFEYEKQPFRQKIKGFIKRLAKYFRNGLKQPDKKLHFIMGLLISLIVGILNPWLGLGLAVIAGGVKELRDALGYGTPEWKDFVFTCLGGACAFPFAWIINYLIW